MVTTSQPLLQNLFNTYLAIGGIITVIVFAALTYALIKYRQRTDQRGKKIREKTIAQPQREDYRLLLVLTVLITALLITLSLTTYSSIDLIKNPEGTDLLEIEVIAERFMWTFKYPEGFSSRDSLVVPKGRKTVLHVSSIDVMHNLHIPDFMIKADAIPGRTNTIWFEPTRTGIYSAQCAELCGSLHARMTATITVLEVEDFEAWKKERIEENEG